ncbi:hypothetical protein [Ktedonospora formicarum]|uniref:Uncharacterized protein n=1 Tax=Ktedonospora formicarum TaxID=2778364 RepID=A0A8J3I805_9CHLR|nr:hypothetical protein [Ktedonospora formicarum]GHO50316.1 hypothetical protein KSX_84790 [Ktedonospora formicarum]
MLISSETPIAFVVGSPLTAKLFATTLRREGVAPLLVPANTLLQTCSRWKAPNPQLLIWEWQRDAALRETMTMLKIFHVWMPGTSILLYGWQVGMQGVQQMFACMVLRLEGLHVHLLSKPFQTQACQDALNTYLPQRSKQDIDHIPSLSCEGGPYTVFAKEVL